MQVGEREGETGSGDQPAPVDPRGTGRGRVGDPSLTVQASLPPCRHKDGDLGRYGMNIRTQWMVGFAVALVASTGCTSASADAAGHPTRASAWPRPYRLGGDGTTDAIYSYPGAIRHTVWVDIGMDQDGD